MGDWHHPEHYTDAAKAHAVEARRASIAVFVERALPAMRETARGLGYALGVHGSQARDLDLVAIPWTDQAVTADLLIPALCETIKAQTGWGHNVSSTPTRKPHGRIAVTVSASFEFEVDLSVMPLISTGDAA